MEYHISEQRLHIRQIVIDAIAETMDLYGGTPSSGQLYGIMFFENKPMTLDEMKVRMNMSKSNMSYAVRSLVESQMVKKLEEKQDRKELYVAEVDFFHTFQNFFTLKLQREINVMTEAISKALLELTEIIIDEHITDQERNLALQDLYKLRHGQTYYEWLQKFVDALKQEEYFKDFA
ncbi:GbsR/MarR family transcriptional regulator [Paenibacillus macquariensis]|nr:transcriptional regulator [Paenibacillus macquariensis subsp. macquariensis]